MYNGKLITYDAKHSMFTLESFQIFTFKLCEAFTDFLTSAASSAPPKTTMAFVTFFFFRVFFTLAFGSSGPNSSSP